MAHSRAQAAAGADTLCAHSEEHIGLLLPTNSNQGVHKTHHLLAWQACKAAGAQVVVVRPAFPAHDLLQAAVATIAASPATCCSNSKPRDGLAEDKAPPSRQCIYSE